MEKKEIETGSPVTINGVTLIPLTRKSVNCWHSNRGFFSSGTKQPHSVIVVSPSARKAFRTTGEEVPLDQLIVEIPSVKELLDGI